MNRIIKYADAPARALLALIFILSGFSKISAYAATQGYMEAFGVPGILLAPAIIFEIGAGIAVMIGFKTRISALLLAGFSVIAGAVFHADFSDQMQQIMFLKNIAMAGGFLILARAGAGKFSVDQRLESRKGAHS